MKDNENSSSDGSDSDPSDGELEVINILFYIVVVKSKGKDTGKHIEYTKQLLECSN
jgi:hypothetical protein